MVVRQSRLVRKKTPIFDFNWLPWQRLLRYRKKKAGLIICHSIPTIWCKYCENRSSRSWDTLAPSEQVRYETKLVAMVMSLKESKKRSGLRKFTQIPFIWWKDRENRSSRSWDNLSQIKKEEINESKFAERAKLQRSTDHIKYTRYFHQTVM